ncbi:MAG: CHAD domain-containing protein [Thermoleophilia bacterium]|nr:CHAD domain-containing protein [Thermoleophilia bacterium]
MARAWDVPGLGPATPFREAAGRVLIVRWRELMSHRDGTLAGEDIEALHAMRVSSRRLRAAMDAFAAAFPRRGYRRRLRVVKSVTDTLGAARDLDVAMDGLRRMLPDLGPADRPGVDALIATQAARRAGEAARIRGMLEALEAAGFGPRFERWVADRTGVDPADLPAGPGGG